MNAQSKITVEDNIPVPARSPGSGPGPKYPWASLAVGQSFYVENPPKYFVSTIYPAGRKLGVKFVSRKEGTGRRVWRVA